MRYNTPTGYSGVRTINGMHQVITMRGYSLMVRKAYKNRMDAENHVLKNAQERLSPITWEAGDVHTQEYVDGVNEIIRLMSEKKEKAFQGLKRFPNNFTDAIKKSSYFAYNND